MKKNKRAPISMKKKKLRREKMSKILAIIICIVMALGILLPGILGS